MKKINFQIARKLNKSPFGGHDIVLSSFTGDNSYAVLTIISPDNKKVKEEVAAYRSLTGKPLGCKIRGKSMQIISDCGELETYSALDVVSEFARGIGFSSEDVLDVLEFLGKDKNYDFGQVNLSSIEMDKDSVVILAEASAEDDKAPEEVFSALMEVLNVYSMGIIKENI